MLANYVTNVVIYTMSYSNDSANPRKKAKCSSTSTSNHKLKRISSTSTYALDDDEVPDRVQSISLENTSVLGGRERQKEISRYEKRIDKTTTNSVFSTGRKFWNCNAKPTSLYAPDNSVIQEENELIGALTNQLYKVETQVQKVQTDLKRSEEQLKAKDQEIVRLKRKVKEWETKSKNQEALRKKEQQQRRIQTDHSEYLYKRCLMLEKRMFEMEKFLSDYGLIWVGDTNSPKCPEKIPNNAIETCYEQIIENIDQLNLAAGKGEVHVQHNERGHGATFKTTSCMSLKFYKNGMVVQDGPLRSYDDPTTISFLQDILDGYFPSELQEAYPDGVPFKVEDHRNQMLLNPVDFPGQGYRLGRQPQAESPPMTTRSRRPPTTTQKTNRRGSLSKDNIPNHEFPLQMTSPSHRNLKSKNPISDAPPMEMYVLRSQILASHNNICSRTHLQSHINAELGLSTRKEKREITARNSDYDASARDGSQKSRQPTRFPSSGRCYHSSTDRISKSPNRIESTEDRMRQRSRSASLPNSRLSITSRNAPRTKAPPADTSNSDSSRFSGSQAQAGTVRRNQRSMKSAAPVRKNAPPILHQINEPSGRSGELRLKVRSLNGGTVYLVHVSADESIARLYQLLDRAMSRSVPRGYKIVLSGYSPRRLEHLGSTLREMGITRDSVLHLVND